MASSLQSVVASPELDALVRRVDEDRWLASRFAPAAVRARLIAIYAVNYEIARIAATVREPGLGAIRLAWWRESLIAIAAGDKPRGHPAVEALANAAAPSAAVIALEAVIGARSRDFEAEPFATWAELEAYVDATAGAVMRAAITICGGFNAGARAFAEPAARAWGFAGLARAALHESARGRKVWPLGDLITGAEGAYIDARVFAPKQQSALFPGFGYVATLPGYLRALLNGRSDTSPLARRWALIVASATGRI